MEDILKFDTIKEYNAVNNQDTLHPLVSMVDLSNADPRQNRRVSFNFYTIFLKDVQGEYGCYTK